MILLVVYTKENLFWLPFRYYLILTKSFMMEMQFWFRNPTDESWKSRLSFILFQYQVRTYYCHWSGLVSDEQDELSQLSWSTLGNWLVPRPYSTRWSDASGAKINQNSALSDDTLTVLSHIYCQNLVIQEIYLNWLHNHQSKLWHLACWI